MRLRIALMFCAAIASADAADRGPWTSVRAEAIRGHVEFLADDLMEGRAAASRGYDIAAAYVASQFREAGLAPGGEDDTFFQNVPLLEATPVLPGSSAELVRGDEVQSFEYGIHYLPAADFTSASSTLTAPLVFAGYGVEAPELGHNDFEGLEVKGRIAVIFSGAPSSFAPNQRAYHSWTHKKWTSLIDHGAVGLITIDSLVDSQRVPWERRVAMSWTPQMRWINADGDPQDAFPALKLRFHFNHDAGASLFEGASVDFAQALASADAGDSRGFELPGLLTLSATTGLRQTQSANVIAVAPGADPQLSNEYVVLTAHLDHLGRGAAVDGDSIYNGAQDNALGVGMLLEMARALRTSGHRPKRSIVFAALTAEEKGLLGSDFLANEWRADGRRIVANINIETPMLFAPLRDLVALGAEHSSLGALARNAAAAQNYRLSRDETPEEVRFIRSDQFSFIRQGAPSIVIKGGYEGRDPATDIRALQNEFRERRHHQPSDDTDLPIDYATAADLARVNLRIALDSANGARPRWNRGDFFAGAFGEAND